MQAGKLRHHLEVQAATETRDAHGGVTRDWRTVDMRWAAVEPLTGRELFEAQQVQGRATVRVRMRPYGDLTPSHRLKFGDRVLNIDSIQNIDERDREMEVLCVEAIEG